MSQLNSILIYMAGRIHFIGGIHGVGKSSLCRDICNATALSYLSASELLKWREITPDPLDKKVADISMTQSRLIDALGSAVQPGVNYLLDGHYCLFNGSGEITPILHEVFEQIKPVSLSIIVGDAIAISTRLEARDGRKYDATLLQKMQDSELKHAEAVSTKLGLSLSIGRENHLSEIVSQIARLNN